MRAWYLRTSTMFRTEICPWELAMGSCRKLTGQKRPFLFFWIGSVAWERGIDPAEMTSRIGMRFIGGGGRVWVPRQYKRGRARLDVVSGSWESFVSQRVLRWDSRARKRVENFGGYFNFLLPLRSNIYWAHKRQWIILVAVAWCPKSPQGVQILILKGLRSSAVMMGKQTSQRTLLLLLVGAFVLHFASSLQQDLSPPWTSRLRPPTYVLRGF